MMIRGVRIALFAATLVGVSTAASHAGATDITGSITFPAGFGGNGYDPANGGVPPGYGNESSDTVAVGSGVEFGFQDTYNRDTADFSSTSLTLQDAVLDVGASGWTQTFTADTSGYFNGLTLVSSNFAPAISYSVTGDTLTVDWGGEYAVAPATYTASFSLTPSASAAPEPSNWVLMVLAVGGAGVMLRRAQSFARPASKGASAAS